MSGTSMFEWATFREILLPSSGNVHDYVAQVIMSPNVNDYVIKKMKLLNHYVLFCHK